MKKPSAPNGKGYGHGSTVAKDKQSRNTDPERRDPEKSHPQPKKGM